MLRLLRLRCKGLKSRSFDDTTERGLTVHSILSPVVYEDPAGTPDATVSSMAADGARASGILMSMLAAVLGNDSQKLESRHAAFGLHEPPDWPAV
jgi:hypothetical protein